MKKTLLSVALLAVGLFASEAKAQVDPSTDRRNVLTVAPLGVINKVKVKYERALTSGFTAGAGFSQYYGLFPGLRFEPFSRFYFGKEAPNGLYVQAQAAVYHHETELDISEDYYYTAEDETYSFTSGGVGAGVGYQVLLGNSKRFVIDVMGGVKYYPIPENEMENYGVWYSTGPGSFLNGSFTVGYAF